MKAILVRHSTTRHRSVADAFSGPVLYSLRFRYAESKLGVGYFPEDGQALCKVAPRGHRELSTLEVAHIEGKFFA